MFKTTECKDRRELIYKKKEKVAETKQHSENFSI
jgi:hypothetical protein